MSPVHKMQLWTGKYIKLIINSLLQYQAKKHIQITTYIVEHK